MSLKFKFKNKKEKFLNYNDIYVSLRLRMQNAGPAEPCVGKY